MSENKILDTAKTLGFGTELEYTNISREGAARAIQSVVGGRISHTGGSYDAWTVAKTPACTSQHVHVGVEDFTAAQIANFARIWYKQEKLLLKAIGTLPSRLAHYTKPTDREFIARLEQMKPQTREQLNIAWYGYANPNPAHYHSSRYRAVNLNNVWTTGTIELRAFNGTNHAGHERGERRIRREGVPPASESCGAGVQKLPQVPPRQPAGEQGVEARQTERLTEHGMGAGIPSPLVPASHLSMACRKSKRFFEIKRKKIRKKSDFSLIMPFPESQAQIRRKTNLFRRFCRGAHSPPSGLTPAKLRILIRAT